jgi:hypothetical protein
MENPASIADEFMKLNTNIGNLMKLEEKEGQEGKERTQLTSTEFSAVLDNKREIIEFRPRSNSNREKIN